MTNRVMPTAKSVLYAIEPVGRSPLAVAAMNAVSVSIDLPTSTPHWGWSPPAMTTTIVSPTARDIASTIEATMPDSAAGNTTRIVVWSFEAPRPKAPSRSDCGTERIESSEIEATIGMIRKPMMIPAESALKMPTSRPKKPRRISGVKKVSAK